MTDTRPTLTEVRDLVADAKAASANQHKETMNEVHELRLGQKRQADSIGRLNTLTAVMQQTCKERPNVCKLEHRADRQKWAEDHKLGEQLRGHQIELWNVSGSLARYILPTGIGLFAGWLLSIFIK